MPTPEQIDASCLRTSYSGQTHKVTALEYATDKRIIVGWFTPILEQPESDTRLLRSIEALPFWADVRIEHVQDRTTGDKLP